MEVGDPLPVAPRGAPTPPGHRPFHQSRRGRLYAAAPGTLIARLERAGEWIRQAGLNPLTLGRRGGLGIVAGGVPISYLDEGLQALASYGLAPETVSVLRALVPNPFPDQEVRALLAHVGTLVVLEELEPHLERSRLRGGPPDRIHGAPSWANWTGRSPVWGVRHPARCAGSRQGAGVDPSGDLFAADEGPERLAAPRPITVCPGCPHRGAFMALQRAIRRSGYRRDQVMVTGDIGCTILGMNPPFEVVWNEVAMGASIGLAQGYVHAGVQTPVVATIGDSTFFHAGIPALVNAVQYGVPLTVVVMDNGWTAMTGMQFNPGTDEAFQPSGNRRVDLARLIPALGVDHFFEVDPFDLDGTTAVLQRALRLPGVKVVLARQECAIQAQRRGLRAGEVQVVPETCNLCRVCILQTGCPAIEMGTGAIRIDPALCYGCGLCAQVCQRGAIRWNRGG